MGRYKEEPEKYRTSFTNTGLSKKIQGAKEIKNNIVRERLHSKCKFNKNCFLCLKNQKCPEGRI